MGCAVLDIFEIHTLLNRLSARRIFHTVPMLNGETILAYINIVRILATTMQNMGVIMDEGELGMTGLNSLPMEYHELIIALEAVGDTGKDFTLDMICSKLL